MSSNSLIINHSGNGSYWWSNAAGARGPLHLIPGSDVMLDVGSECPYYPEYDVALFTDQFVIGPNDEEYHRGSPYDK